MKINNCSSTNRLTVEETNKYIAELDRIRGERDSANMAAQQELQEEKRRSKDRKRMEYERSRLLPQWKVTPGAKFGCSKQRKLTAMEIMDLVEDGTFTNQQAEVHFIRLEEEDTTPQRLQKYLGEGAKAKPTGNKPNRQEKTFRIIGQEETKSTDKVVPRVSSTSNKSSNNGRNITKPHKFQETSQEDIEREERIDPDQVEGASTMHALFLESTAHTENMSR